MLGITFFRIAPRFGAATALIFATASVTYGCDGPAGAVGPEGPEGRPGVSATTTGGSVTKTTVGVGQADFFVEPSMAWLERQSAALTFTMFESTATFTSDPPLSVNFGPEVTVDAIKVLNDRQFTASVFVGKKATTGPRTLIVNTKRTVYRSENAFSVKSPVEVSVISGRLQQGGRVVLKIQNIDSIPFERDTVHVLASPPPGFAMLGAFRSKTANAVQFTALIDPLAPPHAMPFGLGNFLPDGTVETAYYTDGNQTKVASTNAKSIIPGTPFMGDTAGSEFETVVYKLTANAAVGASKLWVVDVAPSGENATPALWLTAASGLAKDLLRRAGDEETYSAPPSMLVPFDNTTGDLYMMVGDAQGRSGPAADIGWNVQASSVPADTVTELAGEHNSGATAQAISTTSAVVVSGKIENPAEHDVYRITWPTPQAITVSVARKNYLGAVTIASDPDFTSNVTVLPSTTQLRAAQARTTAKSSTWYVRTEGTDNFDLTSYVLGVKPE